MGGQEEHHHLDLAQLVHQGEEEEDLLLVLTSLRDYLQGVLGLELSWAPAIMMNMVLGMELQLRLGIFVAIAEAHYRVDSQHGHGILHERASIARGKLVTDSESLFLEGCPQKMHCFKPYLCQPTPMIASSWPASWLWHTYCS